MENLNERLLYPYLQCIGKTLRQCVPVQACVLQVLS